MRGSSAVRAWISTSSVSDAASPRLLTTSNVTGYVPSTLELSAVEVTFTLSLRSPSSVSVARRRSRTCIASPGA